MSAHPPETYALRVHFAGKGFISNPYWLEMDRWINITKSSGLNRAKSEAARRKALEEHLKSTGMTLAEYDELARRARQPFHYEGGGDSGEIIIPVHQIEGFMSNTIQVVRSASRPCPPEQSRSLLTWTPWHTGKTKPDGIFTRFASVTSGTGAKLSNQRGLRNDHFIQDFDATGEVSFSPEFVKPAVLEQAIRLGGENIGIGSARKMGYGRFELVAWEKMGG